MGGPGSGRKKGSGKGGGWMKRSTADKKAGKRLMKRAYEFDVAGTAKMKKIKNTTNRK